MSSWEKHQVVEDEYCNSVWAEGTEGAVIHTHCVQCGGNADCLWAEGIEGAVIHTCCVQCVGNAD